MAQYLSKYLFKKYEDEAIFVASQCELPIINSTKIKTIASMVDDANITLTRSIIICNNIRNSFGKRDILPK